MGKDEIRGFRAGQWVEIVEEKATLQGPAHDLRQMVQIEPQTRTITLDSEVPAELRCGYDPTAPGKRLKLRRWDQTRTSKIVPTLRGVGLTGDWIELEAGIVVQFSEGYYRRGDYWLIPARTMTGDIEWPRYDGPKPDPIPQPPVGIEHHYCCLARIAIKKDRPEIQVDDCRRRFPPLTQSTRLYYVGGDGQEAVQDITHPKKDTLIQLPVPLQVGVAMGQWLVEGAVIEVAVEPRGGNGRLRDRSDQTATDRTCIIKTSQEGVAQCYWWVDNETPIQRARATLLDAEGNRTDMYIVFTARLLQLTTLNYLGGDGQQFTADASPTLPAPLRVGVFQGPLPVKDATVRFEIAPPADCRDTLNDGVQCCLTAKRILLMDLDWEALNAKEPSQIRLSGKEVTVERCSFSRCTPGPDETRSRPLVLVQPRSEQEATELRWKDNRAEAIWQPPYSPAEIGGFLDVPADAPKPCQDALQTIVVAASRRSEHGTDYDSALDAAVNAIGSIPRVDRGKWAKGLEAGGDNVDDVKTLLAAQLKPRTVDPNALRERLDLALGARQQSGYTAALALAPGVGGWLADSTILGELLLQFRERPAFTTLAGSAWSSLFGKIMADNRDKEYEYLSYQLDLGLRGNRLTCVISDGTGFSKIPSVDNELTRFVAAVTSPQEWPDDYKIMGYDSMNVSENVFLMSGSNFAARSLSINGNCFGGDQESAVAYVLGYEGATVGNSRKGLRMITCFWPNGRTEAANLITVQ